MSQPKSPLLEESKSKVSEPENGRSSLSFLNRSRTKLKHVDGYERFMHQEDDHDLEGGDAGREGSQKVLKRISAVDDQGDETAKSDVQSTNTDKVVDEEDLKKWTIDTFRLADKDCDNTIYTDELENFFEAVINDPEFEEKQLNWLKKKKQEWLDEYKEEQNCPDKNAFLKFFKEAKDQGIEAKKINSIYYKKKAGCLGCCFCRCVRHNIMMINFERDKPKEAHYGWMSVVSNFGIQLVHLLDLITDSLLALQMYVATREADEQIEKWGKTEDTVVDGQGKNYDLAFLFIVMAITGPYIIQFSSMINAFFVKGTFEDYRWKKFTTVRKIYLGSSLMVIGLIILPLLDVYIKLRALFLLALIPLHAFGCSRSFYKWIRQKSEALLNSLFMLTFYEVESFEKQKKHTQLIFEDIIMLTLNALIFSKVLDVPIISEKNLKNTPFLLQVTTTIISFITTCFALYIESRGLEEPFMEFIMTSVKAKQDWVPHGDKIRYAKIGQDIDFSRIEFKMGPLTDIIGFYKTFEYQFNEYSLQKLATQILAGQEIIRLGLTNQNTDSNNENQRTDTKIKLGFSVYHVSAHMFLHFIDRIQSDYPAYIKNNINYDEIDYEKMIDNSFELGNFEYEKKSKCCQKRKPKMMDAMTVGGKRLLQICIDNEQGEFFPLKELMELMLQKNLCNPNVNDFEGKATLLTYCLNNKKKKSFELILTHTKVDPNLVNKDCSTTYGTLFYQCLTEYYTREGYKPKENMKFLLEKCKTEIDMHKPSIDILQNGSVMTPIYSYFKRQNDKMKLEGDKLVIDKEAFESYFGKEDFKFKLNIEYFEFLNLFFTPGLQKKAQAYFKQKVTDKIDHIFQDSKDDCGNCLMHITGATFSENQFHLFTSESSFEQLKPHLRHQMLMTNNDNLTPINVLINNDPPLKRIERLLQFDLLPQECFTSCEDELIDFITRKVIKNQKDDKLKGKLVFTKELLNKKFFEVFENKINAYVKQKDSFMKRGLQNIFDQLFKIPEFDEKINNQTKPVEHETELLWEQTLGQIIIKQERQMKRVMIEPFAANNQRLLNDQSINSSQNFDQKSLEKAANFDREHYMLESCLNMLIDVSSILDLISDVIILTQLIKNNHVSWLTVSIFTMLCPYFAVYTSLMNFQIEMNQYIRRKYKEEKKPCLGIFFQITQFLFILPPGLVFLIAYDFIYTLANTVCLLPLIILSTRCTCNRNLIQPFEQKLDSLMNMITGMNYMDIKGFRSQRTILQLQLESIPQIWIQTYMLVRIRQMHESATDLGVDPVAIEVSVAMALTHVFLELINICIESQTWKTSFRDYMLACHNAKQGWIAQRTRFIATDESNQFNDGDPIKFDDNSEKFCSLGYSVSFNFTDMSIESLINIISNLPKIDNSNQRNTVQLGKCISQLSVPKFLNLLTLSFKKVNLVFEEPDKHVRKIFENDWQFMQKLRNPQRSDQKGEFVIIDMVQKDYHQIVQVFIELGAKFDLRTQENNETLVKIAFSKQYPETMRVLLDQIVNHPEYIKDSIQEAEMFYDEIFLREEKKKKPLQPLILLEPKCPIPYEMQNSLIYNLPRLIKADEEIAKEQYDLIFGAYMPNITFKVGDDLEPHVPTIEKWLKRYPKEYKVSSYGSRASFDSSFLCSFIGFRRELLKLKDHVKGIKDQYFDRTIEIERYEFEINNLMTVYKVINKYDDINDYDIERCDEVVRNFGLDKMRDIYFHQSRILASNRPNLTRQTTEDVQMKRQFYPHEYVIPNDVAAIKSFEVIMMKSGLEQPVHIKFFVEYHIGHQKAELKPHIDFKVDPEDANSNDQEMQLLKTFYESTSQNDDISHIKLNQTLLMNIEGTNKLTFKFKQVQPWMEGQEYNFKLKFEFYLRQDLD